MKILFVARATLFTNMGGDTVQITETAKHLCLRGIHVDIKRCNEEIDYSPYDLLHFFNIIRPADILYHIRKSRKPFVVSTNYVEYAAFEKTARAGATGYLLRFFSPDFIEYLKVIARAFIRKEKIVSPLYLLWGHRKSVTYLIKKASLLLPNSYSEYSRLVKNYKTEQKFVVVPNGVNTALFQKSSLAEQNEKLVLCVARIEGLKNQLNLIKAMNDTDYQLLIIGAPATNQLNYFEQCKAIASDNISFIGSMPQEQLVPYYERAKVHVLPSWFETTGLSSLEASAMGCNIVITDQGDTGEYFGDLAFHCDPMSPSSIFTAINEAAKQPVKTSLSPKILSQYTWEIAALKTEEAYNAALQKN
ncbi:glycosyltransferase family 4 protein [Pinibacter aurantiacus]|uniref:Glycosyltransferase family 4 protein n=1 Tax=Pinibacter aurantiacus TaxID=2851599 RepID=A0A9E2S8A6_9BACT|nr:glycosyltransferase family 4 protein [Pinibacter aurantiacus]MBV4356364.1 glycosyltransferase family 4 protein [Pinibacter aurantiacus]